MKGERQKPSFNLRKPGEGENYEKQWKKMVYEVIHCPQRVGRQKYVLDIDIRFSKPAQRNRPQARGPRNGQPQQSGEASPDKENEVRGNNNQRRQRAPQVDNEQDFPSLR
ncbi:hypothetical protein B566_EDAN017772 [Ephemera danica]|nr:hypothetical protein B566_EDAN017772 [Ephemera danica]